MSENINPETETENEDIEVVAHSEDGVSDAGGGCIVNNSHEM
ncbi:hypothetical protein ACGFY6_20050 [Streptomyces sp. NPDC048387]